MINKFLNYSLIFCFINLSSCNSNIDSITKEESISNKTSIISSTKNKDKSIININVRNNTDILDLLVNNIDILGRKKNGSYDVYVTKEQVNYLKTKNIKINSLNNSNNFIIPDGYRKTDEIISIMRNYETKNPSFVKLIDIGDGWEKTQGKSDYDVWALSITSNKQKTSKSTIVFLSGVHSREIGAIEVNLRLIDLLISSYGKDSEITKYLDTREIVFIPLLNIDGKRAVENGQIRLGRNNRHIDEQNPVGIDLNRNFDAHWNFNGVEPMTDELKRMKKFFENNKDIEVYSGSKPFSEPETQALNTFLNNKNISILVDIHSYGEQIFYSSGYTNKPHSMTPLLKKVAKTLSSKNGYITGSTIDIVYPTCGTSIDWAYEKHNALSFTFEVGGESFNPSIDKIENDWNKNKEGFLYLISIADNPIKHLTNK